VSSTVERSDEVRGLAVAFLADAFEVLRRERVIPLSGFRSHVRVGEDYAGPTMMELPSFGHLVGALGRGWRLRFEVKRDRIITPKDYVFGLLELAVHRVSVADSRFDAGGATAEQCIVDMLDALDVDTDVRICARLVTHLTTSDGQPLRLGPMTVRPVAGSREAMRVIRNEIGHVPPGLDASIGLSMSEPMSVVFVSGHFEPGARTVSFDQSREIERFLLAVRLLHASTCESLLEVSGGSHRFPLRSAQVETVRHGDWTIKRNAVLSASDALPIDALGHLLASVPGDSKTDLFTPFGMATLMFSRSFAGTEWDEQLVDLVTGLEALVGGDGNTDLSLRLRLRCAALLGCPSDPPADIFNDLKLLYNLRSKLVHGSTITRQWAEREFGKVTGVAAARGLGVVIDLGLDRLRDLVRRSILMRLALSQSAAPTWPLSSSADIDAFLVDDDVRAEWRSRWRATFAVIGAPAAADRAPAALDAFEL
jgi:hypothetical protein